MSYQNVNSNLCCLQLLNLQRLYSVLVSTKNESSCDSDLILIANLLHASVASVLHSPHDAVTIVLWPSMTESLKQSKLSEGFYFQTS